MELLHQQGCSVQRWLPGGVPHKALSVEHMLNTMSIVMLANMLHEENAFDLKSNMSTTC